jgi:MFS family permease
MSESSDIPRNSQVAPVELAHSVRRWLPIISVEGALANVFIVLTGGAFLTGLALHLGASDMEIGLLGAMPFLAQSAQLISAYLVDRLGERKSLTVIASVIARQVFWLMIPILFLSGSWRLFALLSVVTISGIATMVATPSWLSWMVDLVPDRIRGRYFGNRSAAIAFTTVAATLAGGIILDKCGALGQAHLGFAVIIGIACICALLAVMLLNQLPETERPQRIGVNRRIIMEPLRADGFRSLLRVTFAWNFAIGTSAVFFAPHMITNLQMSFTQISLYLVAFNIAAIALNRPWGILIDRFGSKPVLVICAFGISVIPLIWLFPRSDFLWILTIEPVYSGMLWAGFNLAAFNVPIANSPRERRIIYVAMFAVVSGLAFFGASIAGGALAERWGFVQWHIGPQTIVNYHLLFILSSALRIVSSFLFITFREPAERPLPVMVQFMGYAILKQLSAGLQIFPSGIRRSEDDRIDDDRTDKTRNH